MTTPKPDTEQAPAAPAMPRKGRRRPSAAHTNLLALAEKRTGDAPQAAETAPEAAVAVLEPAPEPVWYRTIGEVIDAKFRRWREARPEPPAPVAEAELPPPPPLPVSPQPVGLTKADEEFLAKADKGIAATQDKWDAGYVQAWRDIHENHRWHRQHPGQHAGAPLAKLAGYVRQQPPGWVQQLPRPAHLADHPEADETLPWVGTPAVAAQEQNHETVPQSWRDTIERELGTDSPPEPPPPAEDRGQVSDDTAEWAQGLTFPPAPQASTDDGCADGEAASDG